MGWFWISILDIGMQSQSLWRHWKDVDKWWWFWPGTAHGVSWLSPSPSPSLSPSSSPSSSPSPSPSSSPSSSGTAHGVSWPVWKEGGNDTDSLWLDPLFRQKKRKKYLKEKSVCFSFWNTSWLYRDSAGGDFTLAPESPAWLLGISQVTGFSEFPLILFGCWCGWCGWYGWYGWYIWLFEKRNISQVDTESIGPREKRGKRGMNRSWSCRWINLSWYTATVSHVHHLH